MELKFKTLQKLSEILINVLWERKEFTIFLTKREREKKRSAVCFVFFLIFFFLYFYKLEANYFITLQWFLSYIEMN